VGFDHPPQESAIPMGNQGSLPGRVVVPEKREKSLGAQGFFGGTGAFADITPLARLRGAIILSADLPGRSSLALLDPGLQAVIPAGIGIFTVRFGDG
jgi:hypothetical protein